MYARCPVIGTRAGGIPDIIEDGVSGMVVEPGSSHALAGAMETMLNHPEKALQYSENAFSFVSRNHTIDKMGDRILGLYKTVMPTEP
jgi:glycosyltransferase involved in cell wall biosynthesis